MIKNFSAFRIFDNKDSFSSEIQDTLYFLLKKLPQFDDLDSEELNQLAFKLLTGIKDSINQINSNIHKIIDHLKTLNIDYGKYENIFWDELKKNTLLYNNEHFEQFIKNLIEKPQATFRTLDRNIEDSYNHIVYLLNSEVVSKAINLSNERKLIALKHYNELFKEILNDYSEVGKQLSNVLIQITTSLTSDIVLDSDIGRKREKPSNLPVEFKDILKSKYKDHPENILKLLTLLDFVDDKKRWKAKKYCSYFFFESLRDNGFIENNESQYNQAIMNIYSNIHARSSQKITKKTDHETICKKINSYVVALKQKLDN